MGIENIGGSERAGPTGTGEGEAGEEFGDGDTYAFVAGGETAFGGDDVGSAAKEVGRHAAGDAWDIGRGGARADLEAGSGFAGEGGEGVFEFAPALGEAGDFGSSGLVFGFGAGKVKGRWRCRLFYGKR